MEKKKLFKYFISCGAVLYTVFSMAFMLISLMMSESSAAVILSPKLYVFLLIYMFVISLGNTFLHIDGLNIPIKRTLHAICYNVGCLAFLLLCGMSFPISSVFTVIFVFIYTATVIIINLASKKSRNTKTTARTKNAEKKNDKVSEKYTGMFS